MIARPRVFRSPKGLALVSTLWVLALLTVIAGALSASVRHEVRFVRGVVSGAQARHAAEAGVQLALKQLLERKEVFQRQAGRTVHDFTLGEAWVRVVVLDAAGKIDLNAADPELLHSLFLSVGVADRERAEIVDAILDWRDGDRLRRANGAEDDDYLAAGRDYGSRDADFASIDELQLVLGMNAAIYRRIRGALTVHSRQRGINPTAASGDVLLAVPGLEREAVEEYVRRRDADEGGGGAGTPVPLIDRRFISATSDVYTIHAAARLPDGTKRRLTVTVSLTPSAGAPYTVLEWSWEAQERL